MKSTLIVTTALCAAAPAALADVTIASGTTPTPTYSTTLNFDEPGGPTGAGLANDAFSGVGLSSLMAGDGFNRVLNLSSTPGFGWLPDTNVFVGGFGIFMNFDTDLTEFSAQVFDNSGPPSPFGGGMIVAVFDDGVEVASTVVSPAFGGSGGDEWYNITTSGGMVFDEVRFVGLTFAGPETIMTQASWNAVPAPGAVAAFGALALVGTRRRR